MNTVSKFDFHCTATMAKLSHNLRSARLKDLALDLLGEQKIVRYEEAKTGSAEGFLNYAKKDADYTFRLFPVLKRELDDKNLWELYEFVEKPFLLINLECQRNGIRYDVDAARDEISSLDEKIALTKLKLNDPKMNWNSHKQLQRKLYGERGIPLAYHKGKVSTGKRALQSRAQDSLVRAVLELKECEALKRQILTIKKFVDPNTGRIHGYINPLGADTGRVTSSSPNLQNIKKDSVLRKMFVASKGYSLIALDFSQIEPRVLAHFLGKQTPFARLFDVDEDFYGLLASELKLEIHKQSDARAVVKQIVLATLYGMGPKTLSENLKVTQLNASEILNLFFSKFPEIVEFKNQMIAEAREKEYVIGLLNRRRYIKSLNDVDNKLKFRAERQVLNSIVQGSAATIFKFKGCELRRQLPSTVRFLHHVHDEYILEAPEQDASVMYRLAKQILERPLPWFSIPLKVDGGIGRSWLDAKNANKKKGGE